MGEHLFVLLDCSVFLGGKIHRREPKDIVYSTMQEGLICCYVVCHGSAVLKLLCCVNLAKYLRCLKLAMKCC